MLKEYKCKIFCYLPYHTSASIVFEYLKENMRFITYITICTTSAQYLRGRLNSAIVRWVSSRIIYMFYSVFASMYKI